MLNKTTIEKAWREGYASGYERGCDDSARFEFGGGSNKFTERDKDEEWNLSDTKESNAKESA